MRTSLVSLVLAVSLTLSAQAAPSYQSWLQDLKSGNSARRDKAVKASMAVNSGQKAEVFTVLIGLLQKEPDSSFRNEVASQLGALFSDQSASLEQANQIVPFLNDGSAKVRDVLWPILVYAKLDDALENRLLALVEDGDSNIRRRALRWAGFACGQKDGRNSAYYLKAAKVFRKYLHGADPITRNLAVYGALQLYKQDPELVITAIKDHVMDSYPPTRSLALNALYSGRYRDDQRLAGVRPLLVQLFADLEKPDQKVPVVSDRDRGVDASGPYPERYRVVVSLWQMGPLEPQHWEYLAWVHKEIEPDALLQIAGDSGTDGQSVISAVLADLPDSSLKAESLRLAATGVSSNLVPRLVDLLEKAKGQKLDEGQSQPYALLLLALGNSPSQPSSIATCLDYLASSDRSLHYAAIWSLSKLDPTGPAGAKAAQALIQMMSSRDEPVDLTPFVIMRRLRTHQGWVVRKGDATLAEYALHSKGNPNSDLGELGAALESCKSGPEHAVQLDITAFVLECIGAQGTRAASLEPAILPFLNNHSSAVRQAAQQALNQITGS